MFALVLAALAAAAPVSPWPAPVVAAAAMGERPRAAPAVIRLPLPPPGRRLGLPAVAGPRDPRRPLVVIDPGHGGVDRGAERVGSGAGEEKTRALALARAVREALLAQGRVRVALTRNDDRLVTLGERAGIARALHADLFVSIHASPHDAAGGGGLGVYTRAAEASDPAAARLAAAENAVDHRRQALFADSPAGSDRPGAALSPQQVGDRSAVLANLVLRESRGRVRLQPRPRKQAPLAALAGLAVPAVLIDAAAAGDGPAGAPGSASSGLARAVARAIATYFARLPPER